MATKEFDCARVPGATCSVKISGERDDVVQAAVDHLAATHPHAATDALSSVVGDAVDNPPATAHALYRWGN